MNGIQEFLIKAQLRGAQAELEKYRSGEKMKSLCEKLRVAEAARLKAEAEAEELRKTLAMMQSLKDGYQMTLIEIIEVLQKHNLVV